MRGYLSVSSSIRSNGDRHRRNAERHLAEGHPEYAAGSMAKAHRNWKRADEIDEYLRPKSLAEAMIGDRLRKAVEYNLYYGNGESSAGGLARLFE